MLSSNTLVSTYWPLEVYDLIVVLDNCKKARALEDAVAKRNAKLQELTNSKKGGTKRKAEDEAEGTTDAPPALKKKKPAPRVTKSRAKGEIIVHPPVQLFNPSF